MDHFRQIALKSLPMQARVALRRPDEKGIVDHKTNAQRRPKRGDSESKDENQFPVMKGNEAADVHGQAEGIDVVFHAGNYTTCPKKTFSAIKWGLTLARLMWKYPVGLAR